MTSARSVVALVSNQTDCVGPLVSNPLIILADGDWTSTNTSTNASFDFTVTAVTRSDATLVVCHMLVDAACVTECARTIATVRFGSAGSVSATSSVAFTNETVGATFTLPTLVAGSSSSRLAWAAPMLAGTTVDASASSELQHVQACRNVAIGSALAVRASITTGTPGLATVISSLSAPSLPTAASYAWCLATADTPDQPLVFPSSSLLVQPAVVTAIAYDSDRSAITVATSFRATVGGRGLSTVDTLALVPSNGGCTAVATSQNVVVAISTATSSTVSSGLTSTPWLLSVSIAESYSVCYRIRDNSTYVQLDTLVVGSVVTRVVLTDSYVASGTPFSALFGGLGLNTGDAATLSATATQCLQGITVVPFLTVSAVDALNASSTMSGLVVNTAGSFVRATSRASASSRLCPRPCSSSTLVLPSPSPSPRCRRARRLQCAGGNRWRRS